MKNNNYLIRSNALGEIAEVLEKNKRVINVYGDGANFVSTESITDSIIQPRECISNKDKK